MQETISMTRAPRAPATAPAGVRLPTGTAVEALVGNTPLVPLRRIASGNAPGVQVLAKAEWLNPGGSVKDRAALSIIRLGEASGLLTPEKVLIDATSGNTGIAYAMLCAALGYRVELVLPGNVSQERVTILHAYGARLSFSDPLEGTDGSIRMVRQIVDSKPGMYFYADQYSNPANWEAHYCTTGPEIWQQTAGQVTHFVAGLGTSGTMMGAGRFLRAMNPAVKLIAVQPEGPFHGLEGLKHMETAMVPTIYDQNLVDEVRPVMTEDAYDMALRLGREEGLFVGISAGAAMLAALEVSRELEHGTVVAILPDGGYRYLSEQIWRMEKSWS